MTHNTMNTTFSFMLKDNTTGMFVAGPFMNINMVPKNVDWNTVTIHVTDWFDAKFGRFI